MKLTRVAILLNGELINDSRVIRVANTLASEAGVLVDVFYIGGTSEDKILFGENVGLYSSPAPTGIKSKLLRHSFFYREFDLLYKKVIATGQHYDFIYANDLPCLYAGSILKKYFGAKLIYDSHEIYNETINQFFPTNAKGLYKIIYRTNVGLMRFLGKRAERKLMNEVDTFITVGNGLRDYFVKEYGVKNVMVIMNLPSLKNSQVSRDLRSIAGFKNNDFLVLYQGVLNAGRGLFTIIEAIKHTPENIKLIFLGYGPLENDLKKLSKKLGISHRIRFVGKVKSAELLSYTRSADCGIVLTEPINLSKKNAVPNKMFEYFCSDLPIITSGGSDVDAILEKYPVGKKVKVDAKEIADAIITIKAKTKGFYLQACRAASEEYNWEKQEHLLKSILKSTR